MLMGLEPMTCGLGTHRSFQLSYSIGLPYAIMTGVDLRSVATSD